MNTKEKGMPDMLVHRRSGAPVRWLLLPLAIAALSSCAPDERGGYNKQTHRTEKYIEQVSNPAPPPVRDLGSAGGGAPIVAVNLPAGVTQEMVDNGQQLYGTVCAACHGQAGAGGPIAPALNDAQWINISGNYDDIVNVIHTGVPNPKQYPGAMPALGGGNFNEEQVRALAAYVLALSQQAGA